MQISNLNIKTVYLYATFLFAFFIGFPQKISSAFLILWSISFIIYKINEIKRDKFNTIRFSTKYIPSVGLILLFILSLLSAIYAADSQLVFDKLFTSRLSLIVLPIFALAGIGELPFKRILKWYIWGNFIFLIYSFISIFYQFYIIQEISLYRDYNTVLTTAFNNIIHRTYSGTNILLSYISIIYLLKEKEIQKKEIFFYSSFFILSLFFLLINNSRSVTITLFLLIIFYSFYFLRKSIKKIIIAIIILIGGLLLITSFPSRISDTIEQIAENGVNSFNDPRYEIWGSSIELIKDLPWGGYGTNNIEKPLLKKYKEINFEYGIYNKLGTHNQYLEFWLELGIIGPILLLLILISIPLTTSKEKRLFAISFFIVFTECLLFESMLGRYSGCITFAFFIALLSSKEDEKENKYFKPLSSKSSYIYPILSLILIIITILSQFRPDKKDLIVMDHSSKFRIEENEKKDITVPIQAKEIIKLDKKNIIVSFYLKETVYFYHMFLYSNLSQGKNKTFSIDCFVSQDFSGDWVKMRTENNSFQRTAVCHYDMEQKGTWQKLQIKLPEGKQTLLFYSCKTNASDFNNLTGYILFCNPMIK